LRKSIAHPHFIHRLLYFVVHPATIIRIGCILAIDNIQSIFKEAAVRRHYLLYLLSILAIYVLAGCAHTPVPDPRARMEESLKKHKAAAVGIAVIKANEITWTGTFGEQAPGVVATSATMFNVASLAKPITAEVAMRLVSAGKLSLDESVTDTWIDPDIANDPRHKKLTPRLLVSHQTGFPNWRFQNKDKKLAFNTEPDNGFTYSGEGYEYLRRFMEKKTGKSFEALVAETVFTPIGMVNASFSERSWMAGRYALPMNRDGEFKRADLAKEGMANAADNLFVTINDYAKFMIAIVKNEGLNPAIAAERTRKQVEIPAPDACKPLPDKLTVSGCPDITEFGLGWITYRFGDRKIVSNSGNDWGEFAIVYIEPATGNGMVIFVNGGNGVPVAMDAMALLDPDSLIAAFGRAQTGR
jgi:CubicO group peptidase (beta-lactamase class C family)